MSLFLMVDLDQFYLSTSIEFLWNSLKNLILHAISLHTPTVQSKFRKQPLWFTSSIRHKLHKIHSLRRKSKQHPTSHRACCLASADTQLQADIKSARVDFEASLVRKFASSKNPSIYRYNKSFVKVQSYLQLWPTILQLQLPILIRPMLSITISTQSSVRAPATSACQIILFRPSLFAPSNSARKILSRPSPPLTHIRPWAVTPFLPL